MLKQLGQTRHRQTCHSLNYYHYSRSTYLTVGPQTIVVAVSFNGKYAFHEYILIRWDYSTEIKPSTILCAASSWVLISLRVCNIEKKQV